MFLPRSCNDEYLISLALRRCLSDKSAVYKQNICPNFVDRAQEKLTEINLYGKDVYIDGFWESVSEKSVLELWNPQTDYNTLSTHRDVTDTDDERDFDRKTNEKDFKRSALYV